VSDERGAQLGQDFVDGQAGSHVGAHLTRAALC
jgi:hypothetical protein